MAYERASTHILTAPDAVAATEDYAKMRAALDAMKSDGFLRDILSDADGVSLHRFQVVAWSIVLGTTYLLYVFSPDIKQLKDGIWYLPVLTTIQLTLLGISTGTYLGLKIPEKQPASS